MTVNQNFVPSFSTIWKNMVNKIGEILILGNNYVSPWSNMLNQLTVGAYVQDIHINPGIGLVQGTVPNSDILVSYNDDIATAYYNCNYDVAFVSSYKEHVARESFSLLENVGMFISALISNLRTTQEYHRNNVVKQMLYNGYQYGMIPAITIDDPMANSENSSKFAVAINTLIDDFSTEINTRYLIYNNIAGMTSDDYRKSISTTPPWVIVFNEYVRDVEFMRGLSLGINNMMGANFRSGNNNQDWQSRLIKLSKQDFPTSIPTIDRNSLSPGSTTKIDNVNFFPMPKDKDGDNLFSGTPKGGDTICGYVISPDALKLYTQWEINTNFFNTATADTTNRIIYNGIVQLGAFGKICAITFNSSASPSP